jgi:hypothetical protein
MKRTADHDRESGQIVVLFALMLVVLMAFAALLFGTAQTLVVRRQLQNGGDAAALAAANLMMSGTTVCTATRISSTGPGNDLYAAAKASVMTNLGWTASEVTARMTVSCPADSAYGNVAVRVDLNGSGPRYFGSPASTVTTSSTALNGQVSGGDYSVALLDNSNPTWTGHGGRTGCPSYLINGGVTVTYEGSIFVDSTCTRATNSNGAVKAGNGAFSMAILNGYTMRIGGEAQAATLARITPTPIENARPLNLDPLSGLVKPCHATDATACTGNLSTLPAQNTSTTGPSAQCGSTKVACVLSPGTYTGGILAANGNTPSTLLLRPGVYFIAGGGVQLKSAAAQIIGIPAATGSCSAALTCTNADAIARYCNPTNNNNGSCQLTGTQVATNWQADCPAPPATITCGVLIYNTASDPGASWSTTGGSADTIANGGQGVILLRAYNPNADSLGAATGTLFASYKNLVIWQAADGTLAPSATSPQPVISMVGGSCVVIAGTVYAPGAEIDFGGSTCGTGGGADPQLTLQFIAWDLTLAGNNNFYFHYRKDAFATPFGYGLVN